MPTEERSQVTISILESEVIVHAATSDEPGSQPSPAILVTPQHPFLNVTVNGEPATGKRSIQRSDVVSVTQSDVLPTRTASINVTSDGMKAELFVAYEEGVHCTLKPTPPSAYAVLSVVEQPIPVTLYTLQDVSSLLAEKNVTYQVDWAAIQLLLASATSGSCVCAVGQSPVPGVAEHYEILAADSGEVEMLGIVPVRPVQSVKQGEKVAKRIPAIPGTPGVNVHGEPIPPKPMTSRLPRIGEGLTEEEDGSVYANRSGRMVNEARLLDVARTMQFDRELKLSDGHILFDGDIVVKGDVDEGVKITAGGHVFVTGTVSSATIVADAGIAVKGGVFASTLSAGIRPRVLRELKELLATVDAEFSHLLGFVEQVERVLSERHTNASVGRVASKILEERYKQPPIWSTTLEAWLDKHTEELDPKLALVLNNIATSLAVHRLVVTHTLAEWTRIRENLHRVIEALPDTTEHMADISVKNGQNSRLEASGTISATGQGFYQCTLLGGEAIKAMMHTGMILGCDATAGKLIEAKEIGSFSEAATKVEITDEEAAVKAGIIHPGTLLLYNAWRHRVAKEMKAVVWP